MNIKDYKGSISLEDLAEGITAQPDKSTLGAVWEHTIDCNHCCYYKQCIDLYGQFKAEYGIGIYCSHVIDFLIGDKTVEDILEEARYANN